MKNLLITGYRAHELGIFDQKHKGIPYIRRAIETRLIPLIEEGLEWIVTPGQYGVDLWACETAIELRERYPQLKISILTAFDGQEEKWKEDKQEYYRGILRRMDYVGSVSKQPYSGPWQFQARDDLLLRKTDGILLVYDDEAGEGSPKFMKAKALRKNAEEGYRYLSIGAEEIQSLANEQAYGDYD
ncbi:DUF1273 domain-containing protein [Cohnella hongkongensis]|uniref:DUF1273 domain-containing protein n=1 Tax=Cohnella hongkongensis TaxID=178337 RepID=A0ABV9FCW5_9BACL